MLLEDMSVLPGDGGVGAAILAREAVATFSPSNTQEVISLVVLRARLGLPTSASAKLLERRRVYGNHQDADHDATLSRKARAARVTSSTGIVSTAPTLK